MVAGVADRHRLPGQGPDAPHAAASSSQARSSAVVRESCSSGGSWRRRDEHLAGGDVAGAVAEDLPFMAVATSCTS